MNRTLELPPSWRKGAVGLIALGAAGLIFGGLLDLKRVLSAFLADFTLFAGIAQAGVVFVAILVLTQARWAGPLSWVGLSFAGFLPASFGLFLALPLLFGKFYQHVAQGRLPAESLFIRDGVILLLLWALSWAFRSGLRDGPDADPTGSRRSSILAPMLLIAYAYGWSWLAFDLLMALAPEWVSTLFGAFIFVGNLYGALAATTLAALLLARAPHGAELVTPQRLHDLGKLLFAFCLLWTYLLFSQILPIWYGNLPREIGYLAVRAAPPWSGYAWTTLLLAFAVPFAALLGRAPKRKPLVLAAVCLSILIGLWLERSLMVAPALSKTSPLGWIEVSITLGYLGVFVLSIGAALRRAAIDPAAHA
jgi:hypothetical protein